MNNRLFLLTIAALLCASTTLKAQELQRAQSVYFEAAGPGLLYSINYDTRFQGTADGLGGRIGASFLAIDGESLVTVPAVINYLLGKDGRYFEVGLGTTYFYNNDNNDDVIFEESGFVGTMVFGYRSQPVDGGFMFRAGFAPVFNQNNFVPYYPYLSLGYTF